MQSLGQILPEFLKEIVDDEELCLIFLTELWPRLVGERVARRSRPLSLRAKRLRVAVFNEGWGRELEPLIPGIIQSVNAYWRSTLIERIAFEFRPMD